MKADDGSLYFIRDEILDACKVEGEYLEDTQKLADSDGDVEGFAFSARAQNFTQVANYSSPNLNLKAQGVLGNDFGAIADKVNNMSTVMCPW